MAVRPALATPPLPLKDLSYHPDLAPAAFDAGQCLPIEGNSSYSDARPLTWGTAAAQPRWRFGSGAEIGLAAIVVLLLPDAIRNMRAYRGALRGTGGDIEPIPIPPDVDDFSQIQILDWQRSEREELLRLFSPRVSGESLTGGSPLAGLVEAVERANDPTGQSPTTEEFQTIAANLRTAGDLHNAAVARHWAARVFSGVSDYFRALKSLLNAAEVEFLDAGEPILAAAAVQSFEGRFAIYCGSPSAGYSEAMARYLTAAAEQAGRNGEAADAVVLVDHAWANFQVAMEGLVDTRSEHLDPSLLELPARMQGALPQGDRPEFATTVAQFASSFRSKVDPARRYPLILGPFSGLFRTAAAMAREVGKAADADALDLRSAWSLLYEHGTKEDGTIGGDDAAKLRAADALLDAGAAASIPAGFRAAALGKAAEIYAVIVDAKEKEVAALLAAADALEDSVRPTETGSAEVSSYLQGAVTIAELPQEDIRELKGDLQRRAAALLVDEMKKDPAAGFAGRSLSAWAEDLSASASYDYSAALAGNPSPEKVRAIARKLARLHSTRKWMYTLLGNQAEALKSASEALDMFVQADEVAGAIAIARPIIETARGEGADPVLLTKWMRQTGDQAIAMRSGTDVMEVADLLREMARIWDEIGQRAETTGDSTFAGRKEDALLTAALLYDEAALLLTGEKKTEALKRREELERALTRTSLSDSDVKTGAQFRLWLWQRLDGVVQAQAWRGLSLPKLIEEIAPFEERFEGRFFEARQAVLRLRAVSALEDSRAIAEALPLVLRPSSNIAFYHELARHAARVEAEDRHHDVQTVFLNRAEEYEGTADWRRGLRGLAEAARERIGSPAARAANVK